jgi:hypothetical protein
VGGVASPDIRQSKVEYRVTYRRSGRKRSTIFQTRKAAERYVLVLQGRRAEWTGAKPEDYACCSGWECGCRGQTNAEVWAEIEARIPPLEEGPTIEQRAVGGWAEAA